MKACPLCGSTYADRVDFCFKDGAPLVAAPDAAETAAAAPAAEPTPPAPMPTAAPAAVEPHTGPIPGLADESDLPEPAGLAARQQALASGAADLPTPQLLPSASGPEEGQTASVAPVEPSTAASAARPVDEEDLAPAEALKPSAGAFAAPTLVPQRGDETEEVLAEAVALAAPTASGPGAQAPLSDTPTLPPADEDAFFDAGGSDFGASAPFEAAEDPEEQGRRKGAPWLALALVASVLLVVGGVALLGGSEEAQTPGSPATSKPAAQTAPAPAPPSAPVREAPVAPSAAASPEADAASQEETPATDGRAPDDTPPSTDAPVAAVAPATPAAPAAAPEPPATSAAPQATAETEPSAAPRARSRGRRGRAARPVPAAATEPATSTVPDASDAADSPWGAPSESGAATLTITSKPSGAKVFVDGAVVGTAPVSHSVTFGSHEIRAELPGYRTATQSLDAEAATQSVSVVLQPAVIMGAVNILGVTGAQVRVDGNAIGSIPTIAQLSEGKHSFEVTPTDGAAFTRVLDIQFPGPGKAFTVDLQP